MDCDLEHALDAEHPIGAVVFVDADRSALAFRLVRGTLHPSLATIEDVAALRKDGEVAVDAILAADIELGIMATIAAIVGCRAAIGRIITPDHTSATAEVLVGVAQAARETMRSQTAATSIRVAVRVGVGQRDTAQ